MAGSSNNILISPVNVFWRIEHQSQFDLSGLVDPDGTSFDIPDSSGNIARVWFDLDTVSTPPATPAGGRLIEVAVTTGDASTVIAAAAQAAIDGDSEFSAAVSSSLVTVTGAAVGEAADPVDVDSGVGITVCRRGKNFDLGLLEGEPSPSFEPSNFDVTSQQTGTTITAKLVQGYTASVETVLQETTKSKLREMYKIYGEAFTPAAGTEVYGVGTGQIGKNLVIEGARLEFVPVNVQSDELSYNYTLRLAIPTPGSLVFSGENPRTLTVTWDAIPDLQATRSDLDMIVVGDITQAGVL
jgi:hypothetical protein